MYWRTSSIAITTSTVSRLSRPKSFEKWDVFESSGNQLTGIPEMFVGTGPTLDASETCAVAIRQAP